MPYKISGTLSDAARIIIIKEADWSIESNSSKSSGAYEADDVENNAKLVIARKSDGEILAYGNVSPTYYVPVDGDTATFMGGNVPGSYRNVIEYKTISTSANCTDFGDTQTSCTWCEGTSNGGSARGVFTRGQPWGSNFVSNTEYITITSAGNSATFGNLTQARGYIGAVSNSTNDRGLWAGGYHQSGGARYNIIDYVTLSTTGASTDFGDLTVLAQRPASVDSGTNDRGVWMGRHNGSTWLNTMDYVTISTTGNASDFGDLSFARYDGHGLSNRTSNRGVMSGGYSGSRINNMDYISINSTGNSTDFGDLSDARCCHTGASNGTNDRGLWAGGSDGGGTRINIIEYITISSTGNATDLCDLTEAKEGLGSCQNA